MTTPPQQAKRIPPPAQEMVDDGQELRMSLWEHLAELRTRLTRAVLALIAGVLLALVITEQTFLYLLGPYRAIVGPDNINVLDPTEALISYLRVSLLLGAILAMPVITYQLLMFIIPGLTRKERRILLTALPAITALFLIGVSFAWFVLIPPALDFLANFYTNIFQVEWTSDAYVGFITALLFWMGAAFQTPLIFFVLSLLGQVTPGPLIRNWRIAVVGAAAASALITPTVDPVNMFLVMAPLLVLYLISVVLVFFGSRRFNAT